MPTTLYEKVIAVIGMLRNSIDQKTSKLDLAPLFNTSVNYPVDSLVVYKNVLYVCTTAHSGEWYADDFATATIDDILRLKANKSEFAPEYSDSDTYAQYQLVIKGGKFMQCMSAGTGPGAVFTDITVAQVVERLDQAIKQAASIDAVYAVVENIAPKYEVFKSYKVGDRCSYNGVVYECITAVQGESENPDSSFWATYWSKKTVDAMLRSLKNEISNGYVQKDSDATLASLAMRDTSTGYGGPTLVIGGSDRSVIVMKDRMLVVAPNDPNAPADGYVIHFPATKSGTMALLQDLAPSLESIQPTEGVYTFKAGQMVTYRHKLYLCTTGYNVSVEAEQPIFAEDFWTECTIEAVFNALIDSISELANSALSYAFVNTQKGSSSFSICSTEGFVQSAQYAPVSRIFIDPKTFEFASFVSFNMTLMPFTGDQLFTSGNYSRLYFRPSYLGIKQNQFLNSVALYAGYGSGGGFSANDKIFAALHKPDGSLLATSEGVTWSGPAPDSNTFTALSFRFASSNQIDYVDQMWYVTFHTKDSEGSLSNEKQIRVRARSATMHNQYLYLQGVGSSIPCCDIEFSDCASGSGCGSEVFSVAYSDPSYAYLCKMPKDSVRERFTNGVIVQQLQHITSSRGMFTVGSKKDLDEDSYYFLAFDKEVHAEGSEFSGGLSVYLNLYPSSYTFSDMALSCDGDASFPPMVIKGDPLGYDEHVPILLYRDSFQSSGWIPFPPKQEAEMELRYLIYGNGSPVKFPEHENEIVPLDGSFTDSSNQDSWKTVVSGKRYIYIFKSVGKILGEIYEQGDDPTQLTEHTIGFKRLWTVERYSA